MLEVKEREEERYDTGGVDDPERRLLGEDGGLCSSSSEEMEFPEESASQVSTPEEFDNSDNWSLNLRYKCSSADPFPLWKSFFKLW
jgi:hypothetical protein